MSDYEKQLEEANQKLREQLEKETARADALEKKVKELENPTGVWEKKKAETAKWRAANNVKNPDDYMTEFQRAFEKMIKEHK